MSLNGMLIPTDLGTGTYTITRTATLPRVLGRSPPGVTSTFDINLGIEPASGRQLRDLPEGRRGDETIMIFSPVELKTEMPGFEPDQVLYRGELWAVVTSRRWEGFSEVHYEVMAQRAPSPAGVVP